MNHVNSLFAVVLGVAAFFAAGWGVAAILKRYLQVSTAKAVSILILSLAAGIAAGIIRYQERYVSMPVNRWFNYDEGKMAASIFAGLLTAFAVVFMVKLYSKWIAGKLTDAEKLQGMEGARVWLSPGNLVCVVLLSLLGWLSFGYQPAWLALAGLLVLLAYPGGKWVIAYLNAAPAPSDSSAPERQRVLSMLDAGKITAAECAELLGALNFSEKPQATPALGAPPQKLALIGAVILLVGFFLPWFSFNPQSEANRLIQRLPIDPNWARGIASGITANVPTINISGGDIEHGLGWVVLSCGIVAAALPYFAANLSEQTRQRAILAGLGVGAILLIYVVTQNFRFVSIGILLAAVGYGLQLAGALHGGRFHNQPVG